MPSLDSNSHESDEYTDLDVLVLSTPSNNVRGTTARAGVLS